MRVGGEGWLEKGRGKMGFGGGEGLLDFTIEGTLGRYVKPPSPRNQDSSTHTTPVEKGGSV